MSLEKEMNGINAYKELCASNIIRLDGEVNEESARHVCTLLTIMDDRNEEILDDDGTTAYKPIYLYINSPGGSIYDGLAIIDTMTTIKSPVFTVCCGLAASMGAAILSAGDLRFVSKNSTIMLHEASSGTRGKVSIQQEDLDEAKRLNDILEEIISKNCGMAKSKYHKITYKKDVYLSPDNAIEFGIVDKILQPKEKSVAKRYLEV